MSSEFLCLRISRDVLPVGLMTYLIENGLHLLVKEKGSSGDNPHFQGIIKTKVNSIRTYFKRIFEGGNKDWSVKKCPEPGRFAQYLSKELLTGGEVIYNEGYDMKALNIAYHEEAVQVKSSTKKRRIDNVTEEIWADKKFRDTVGCSTDGRVIAAGILRWHIDAGRRVPNSFNMQTLAMTYVVRNNDLSNIHDRLSDVEMVSRLYPNINF